MVAGVIARQGVVVAVDCVAPNVVAAELRLDDEAA